MPGINTLLSDLSQVAGLGGSPPPRSEPQSIPVSESGRAEGDIFQQGQWWKNRAVFRVSSGLDRGPGYGSGGYQRSAVQAYEGRIYQTRPGMQGDAAQNGIENDTFLPGANPADGQKIEQRGKTSSQENEEQVRGENRGKAEPLASKGPDGEVLSQAERQAVTELKSIDAAVRAHEMSHQAAGGQYVRGGASFTYKRGPDGNRYAVGGEVHIDTSKESTPQKTIAKMQVVRAAALAPANPSPQDRRVAANASSAITQARQEQRIIDLEEEKKRTEAAAEGLEQHGQPPGDVKDSASNSPSISDSAGSPGPIKESLGPPFTPETNDVVSQFISPAQNRTRLSIVI